MKKRVLTQSSVSVLQDCKRKYKLRYIDNLETVTKPTYLAIGTAFHRAVEVFRKGGSLDDMKRAALAPYVDLSHDDLVTLHAMVMAYHRKYGHEPEYHEVEKEWRLDYGSYALAGVVDALKVSSSGDSYWIYETKTCSRIDGSYIESLWSKLQTILYQAALEQQGYNIIAVMYDIVQKPPTKRHLATPADKRKYVKDKDTKQTRLRANQRDSDESDSEFLARLNKWYADNPGALHREEIVNTPSRIAEVLQEMDDEARNLEFYIDRDAWPKTRGSCFGKFNTKCEFLSLCEATKPELIKENHYRVREKTHEELEGETNGNTN